MDETAEQEDGRNLGCAGLSPQVPPLMEEGVKVYCVRGLRTARWIGKVCYQVGITEDGQRCVL